MLGVNNDPKPHFYSEISDFDFSELCADEDRAPQKKENGGSFMKISQFLTK